MYGGLVAATSCSANVLVVDLWSCVSQSAWMICRRISCSQPRGGELPAGLADGPATLRATARGFEAHTQKVLVMGNYLKDAPVEVIFLRKLMRSGTISATLRWGERPADLDLHCVSSEGDHVYFGQKKSGELELDIDVVNSYGPETLTVEPQPGHAYTFFVRRYQGKGDIALSTATVEVRIKEGAGAPAELLRVAVPTNPTTNLSYWHVGTIQADEAGRYSFTSTEFVNRLVADEKQPPLARVHAATASGTKDEP